MGRLVDFICRSLSRIPHSGMLLIVAPLIVAGGRCAQELLLLGLRKGYAPCSLPFLNYLVTYMLIQIGVLAVFAIASERDYREFTGVTSAGLFLAWLPPLIDGCLLLAGFRQPQRLYIFFRELSPTFFSEGQLFGESVTLWLSVGLFGIYLAWRARSVVRVLVGVVLYYGLVHLLGFVWPAVSTVFTGDLSIEAQAYMDLLGIAFYWGIYVLLNLRTTGPSTLRFGHALPWGLLAAIGARLAGDPWWQVFLYCAMFASVVFMAVYMNDYFDRTMDGRCGGRARPATGDDALAAFLVQVVIILHIQWIDPDRFYHVATFAAIIAAYHHPRVRLKRVLGMSYLLEGISAALAVMFGMGLAGLKGDPHLAFAIVSMTFVGFTLGSVMKDYKDVDQDDEEGISTAYTWLARRRVSPRLTHGVLSTAVTCALAAPVAYLVLNELDTWKIVLLAAASLVPQAALLALSDRRRAVQVAIWGVNLYLALMVVSLPTDVVRLFE